MRVFQLRCFRATHARWPLPQLCAASCSGVGGGPCSSSQNPSQRANARRVRRFYSSNSPPATGEKRYDRVPHCSENPEDRQGHDAATPRIKGNRQLPFHFARYAASLNRGAALFAFSGTPQHPGFLGGSLKRLAHVSSALPALSSVNARLDSLAPLWAFLRPRKQNFGGSGYVADVDGQAWLVDISHGHWRGEPLSRIDHRGGSTLPVSEL